MSVSQTKELYILQSEGFSPYKDRSWKNTELNASFKYIDVHIPDALPASKIMLESQPIDLAVKKRKNAFLESRKRALQMQKNIEQKRILAIEEEAKISPVWED